MIVDPIARAGSESPLGLWNLTPDHLQTLPILQPPSNIFPMVTIFQLRNDVNIPIRPMVFGGDSMRTAWVVVTEKGGLEAFHGPRGQGYARGGYGRNNEK